MSNYILPIMVLIVVLYGIYKKINIYDTFVDGAKESFDMIFQMFPGLLAMIMGVNIFINSGILEFIFQYLKDFFLFLKIPFEIFPLVLIRPISGNAALAITNSILEQFGPDSFLGKLVSVIQGSTDTTFYVLTLYFGTVGIKKIRYALWAGLLADFVGILIAIFLVNALF